MPATPARHRRKAAGLLLGGALLLTAACGSNDSATAKPAGAAAGTTPSAGASAGASDAGLGKAKALVDQHSAAPTKIGLTEPIGAAIPSGKKLIYINCGAEACVNTGNALKEAGAVLGWTVDSIDVQPTPQGIQAGFDEAVRRSPDGVAYNGLPVAAFQRQLAELSAKKIPVAAAFVSDPVGGGLVFTYVNAETVGRGTQILASKAVVDSGGKAAIGLINITDYPIVNIYTKAFADQVAATCKDCTTKKLDVQVADIGKDAPAKIVNFVRANKLDTLYLALDDFAIGLPAALKNAGLSSVKIYSWAPTSAGIAGLQSGERTASVPTQQREGGWYLADAFARVFAGKKPVQPGIDDIPWVIWAKDTKAGVPTETKNPAFVQGYQEQFKALWGK